MISSRALIAGTAVATVLGAAAAGTITYYDSIDSPSPFNLWENNAVGVAMLAGVPLAAFSHKAGLGRGGAAIGLMLAGMGVGELIGGHLGARSAGSSGADIRRSWMPLPPAPGTR